MSGKKESGEEAGAETQTAAHLGGGRAETLIDCLFGGDSSSWPTVCPKCCCQE